MKSANKHTLIVTVALFLLVAIGCAASASAQAATPRLIQQHTLTAKGAPQTWLSKKEGGHVFVAIFGPDGEIEQHYVDQCRASYPDPVAGIYVWVRIQDCGPGRHPFVVRYLSTRGAAEITVRLTEQR